MVIYKITAKLIYWELAQPNNSGICFISEPSETCSSMAFTLQFIKLGSCPKLLK